MSSDALVTALREVVGERHCLTDPALCASYETDWTRRFHGTARAVVRPASTAEVAAILRACAAAGAGVSRRAATHGLVGGSSRAAVKWSSACCG